MTNTEAAWLAGFVDGEGTLTTYVGSKGYTYFTIGVYNNVRPALDYVAEITGCGTVKKRSAGTGEWVWRSHSMKDVLAVLEQIRPYLRVKQDTADEIIRALSERVTT